MTRPPSLNPNDYVALGDKGNILSILDRHEEAIIYFNRALDLNPNYQSTIYGKALSLANIGRNEEALTYFDKLLALAVLINKGIMLADMGKFLEAEITLEKVLVIDPNNTKALNEKGAAVGNLGRTEDAISYFDKVLLIDSNNTFAMRGQRDRTSCIRKIR